jgi:hypothetical protein
VERTRCPPCKQCCSAGPACCHEVAAGRSTLCQAACGAALRARGDRSRHSANGLQPFGVQQQPSEQEYACPALQCCPAAILTSPCKSMRLNSRAVHIPRGAFVSDCVTCTPPFVGPFSATLPARRMFLGAVRKLKVHFLRENGRATSPCVSPWPGKCSMDLAQTRKRAPRVATSYALAGTSSTSFRLTHGRLLSRRPSPRPLSLALGSALWVPHFCHWWSLHAGPGSKCSH